MSRHQFACNGASARGRRNVVRLDYLPTPNRNIRLDLPRFVDDVLHLPDRVLDLLELAAFVYVADRSALRGSLDAVEYHSWAREISLTIRVRDVEFWAGRPAVVDKLREALIWMTGDADYQFAFQPGHATPPSNLFAAAQVALPPPQTSVAVMPFSGGLDSLAGALKILAETNDRLFLISHQSNPRTKKTQATLVASLRERYPDRLVHYAFDCTLSGTRGREETQRSRSFLYTSIAAAIADSRGASSIQIFENGVTSLNFARRQDLLNARSSRTTHPQTLGRLSAFFCAFFDRPFEVQSPFRWSTKGEIIETVATYAPELLTSAVSCTATFQHLGDATHCGECFQCIDRRLASFAGGHDDLDHPGLYSVDITREPFSSGGAKTTAVDYIRQAAFFERSDANDLERGHANDLSELLDWSPGCGGDNEIVVEVHSLLARHGAQVKQGLKAIREKVEDPFKTLTEGSLLSVLSDRPHLRPEVELMAEKIAEVLEEPLLTMYRKYPPENEAALNDTIRAILASHGNDLRSEFPVTQFACARVVPDHELELHHLLVEAKFLRNGTTPSKASEAIAADLTKYPQDAFILFVVVDLGRSIPDPIGFRRSIESKRKCKVVLIR